MAKNDSNAKHHEGWKTDERVKSIMPVTNWKVQKLCEELAAGDGNKKLKGICELGTTRWEFETKAVSVEV